MKIQERNVQTLLSRQDLAQRWDLTTQAILNYEQQVVISIDDIVHRIELGLIYNLLF